MRYVTPVVIEFEVPSGATGLATVGAAMVEGVPHVGLGWLSGQSPTNAIEELAAFVDATTPRAPPGGRLVRGDDAGGARPAAFEWFDVQRTWTSPHDPERFSDHFEVRRVRFEDDAYEDPQWGAPIAFATLPSAFRTVLLRDVMQPIQVSGRL